MAANNLRAIGIQLIVIVLFYAVSFTASTESAFLLFSFSTIIIYFIAGFVLLKPTVKSPVLSVSALFIILFINAVASLIVILTNAIDVYWAFFIIAPTESIVANPVNWCFVELTKAIHIPPGIDNQIVHGLAILTSALPSLLMYLGMMAKKNAREKKVKV